MPAIEIVDMIRTLRIERSHTRNELKKLEKVISALREFSANTAPIRRGKRRMSASARRKIAEAQKLRWEKFRQAKRMKA
jgi:hypothetical protein